MVSRKNPQFTLAWVAAIFLSAVVAVAQPEPAQDAATPDAAATDVATTGAEPATPNDAGRDSQTIKMDDQPAGVDRGRTPVTAEDILKEFQKERPVAEPLLPRPQAGETDISSPLTTELQSKSGARLPDGYMLVDRTGRLSREGEWWVISFLSDNHPQTAPEPPMKLLPNRMLERMVRESESSNTTVEFIVSGETTDFLGENYLLLRKLMRKRDLGNLSR